MATQESLERAARTWDKAMQQRGDGIKTVSAIMIENFAAEFDAVAAESEKGKPMSDVSFAGLKALIKQEWDSNISPIEVYADRLEKAFEELRDEAEAMEEITSSAPKSEYARHIEARLTALLGSDGKVEK